MLRNENIRTSLCVTLVNWFINQIAECLNEAYKGKKTNVYLSGCGALFPSQKYLRRKETAEGVHKNTPLPEDVQYIVQDYSGLGRWYVNTK